MQRRELLAMLGIAFMGLALNTRLSGAEVRPSKYPNILVLYTDQQRYDTIAALGNGIIKTPNLDRLCREGVTFTNAFATAPVCTPSRTSFFSGQYTTSHRTYSNHHVGPRPQNNLALALKQRGYRTGLFGKNHCFLKKGQDIDVMQGTVSTDVPAGDIEAWFEKAGLPMSPSHDQTDLDQTVGVYQTPIRKRLLKSGRPVEANEMHQVASRALSFMQTCNKAKQPFFAWVSWLYPHTPYAASDPFYGMYENVKFPPVRRETQGLAQAGKPFRQVFHQENNNRILPFDETVTERMRKTYYASTSQIDFEIGRFLDYLEQNGQAQDTIVIFTSDHGDYQGDHGLYTKSPALYDCLIRVPLIFRWTNHWARNVRSSELISHVDIMPTLLKEAGIEVPAQCQGIALNDLLTTGRAEEPIRQAVFAEYGIPGRPFNRQRLEEAYPQYQTQPIDYWGSKIPWEANPISLTGRFRMIRTQQWKLIHNPGDISELYDLEKDPSELVNRFGVAQYQAIQTKLFGQLKAWQDKLPGIEKEKTFVDTYNAPFFQKAQSLSSH